MREILFRGQVRRKGEKVNMAREPLPGKWVYGGVFVPDNGGDFSIIYGAGEPSEQVKKYLVYADTVGQYTGMTDRTRTRIFEGDIVQVGDELVLIVWRGTGFVPLKKNKRPMTWFLVCTTGKIIGNEFDDPELLKGEPPCSQPSKP